MKAQLKDNWGFLLTDTIHRGAFFLLPQLAIEFSAKIDELLSGVNGGALQERPDYSMRSGNGTAVWGIRDNFDQLPKNSVAIFPIQGTMLKDGSLCTYGTAEIEQFMQQAAANKNVVAAVLDIDSGGGAVNAVAPMLRGVNYFQKAGKPVIAHCDVCCSAAYYAAAKCDFIMADNLISTEFGSIGVMMQFVDTTPILEAAGAKKHIIIADESSDKNQAFILALEGKYDLIKKEYMSPMAIQFQSDVKKMRGAKLKTETPGILSGKTFFATDAIKYGLADGMGSLMDAVQLAIELS